MPASSTSARPAFPRSRRHQPADATTGSARAFRRGALVGALSMALVGGIVAAAVLVRPPSTAETIHANAAKIRAQDAVRNKHEVKVLTGTTRGLVKQLTPVLQEMYRAMPPPGAGKAKPPSAQTVAGWRRTISLSLSALGSPPSGDTSYNVARAGFTQAVKALDDVAATYALSFGAPSRLSKQLITRATAERTARWSSFPLVPRNWMWRTSRPATAISTSSCPCSGQEAVLPRTAHRKEARHSHERTPSPDRSHTEGGGVADRPAGPISVEWEDAGMDRLVGAPEALEFVRRLNFDRPSSAFDAAFRSGA